MDTHKYLIVGGSTKCGTTSVFNYFEFHPQVSACQLKESRYFWKDDYPLLAASRNHNNVGSFSELFPDKNAPLRFEATPDYLYSTASAEAIKSRLQDVKLVFILREPVDRLRSWYKFANLNGLIDASLSFNDYIEIQKKDNDRATPQHLRALEQNRYAHFLKNYIELFGESHIKIMFYENLKKDPLSFCREICEFSGLESTYFDAYEFRKFNVSAPVRNVNAHTFFRKMKRSIRPVTRLFANSVRKKIKWAGQHVEMAWTSANQSTITLNTELPAEQLLWLENYYLSDLNQLRQMTPGNIPWSKV